MKKPLKLGFGRQLPNFHIFPQNIFSSLCRIKLHTENQPPTLFNSGEKYKEDLKIRIWKTTTQYFQLCSQNFFYLG